MPMYEYLCNKCKQYYELLRSYSERDDLSECPHCKAKAIMTRLPSLASGSGHSRPKSSASCGHSHSGGG